MNQIQRQQFESLTAKTINWAAERITSEGISLGVPIERIEALIDQRIRTYFDIAKDVELSPVESEGKQS